jgi:hypothetical protein
MKADPSFRIALVDSFKTFSRESREIRRFAANALNRTVS